MAADKKPTMSREDAQAHLKAGHVLAVGPNVYRRGDRLPSPPEEDRDTPLEAVVIRGPDGNLTHAGMEWTIRQGGSVLHRGEIIDNLDNLPDEAELARHDQQATEALAKSYDDQIAALQQQKAKLAEKPAAESSPAAPARTHGPTAETHPHRAAEEDEGQPRHPPAKAPPKRG